MRAFAEAYSTGAIVQQAVGQFVQQAAAQLSQRELSQAVTELPAGKVQQPAGQLESHTPPEPFASLPWFHNLAWLSAFERNLR